MLPKESGGPEWLERGKHGGTGLEEQVTSMQCPQTSTRITAGHEKAQVLAQKARRGLRICISPSPGGADAAHPGDHGPSACRWW